MPVIPTPGNPVIVDISLGPYWAGADCEVPFIRWDPGETVYATIGRGSQVIQWDGYEMVDYVPDNWADYAVPTHELPAGSGQYYIPFDNNSAADYYTFAWYTPTTPGSPSRDDRRLQLVRPYWSGSRFGEGHLTKASNDKITGYDQLLLAGAVDDATPTATQFKGSATFASDSNFYNGRQVCFTSGVLSGLKQSISTYVGSTREFTVSPGFPEAPADGDEFKII